MLKYFFNKQQVYNLVNKWEKLLISRNFKEAEDCFDQVLDIEMYNTKALHSLCYIHKQQKNYRKLYNTTLKLLHKNPTSSTAISDHWKALLELYSYRDWVYFLEIITTYKKNRKIWNWIKWHWYYQINEKQKAYETFKYMIDYDKKGFSNLPLLVKICLLLGKKQEAQKYHQKAEYLVNKNIIAANDIFKENQKKLK